MGTVKDPEDIDDYGDFVVTMMMRRVSVVQLMRVDQEIIKLAVGLTTNKMPLM